MHEVVTAFFDSWTTDPLNMKPLALALYKHLHAMPDVDLEFKARPGVSYSLRVKHRLQTRPLFVLVDIIDDEPEQRWLSLCFYDDLITDPEERGDQVPGGLFGQDARCFDIDAPGTEPGYFFERLNEAHAAAARE